MSRNDILFSIIVPTRNRPARLQALLRFLQELDYPRDRYEVIVVDDGGDGGLLDAPEAGPPKLSILRQPPSGPAMARNRGAQLAAGQVLVFLDDDCTPPRDWLQRLERRFAENPESAVGGEVVNALPDNAYSTATHLVGSSFLRHQNRDSVSFLASSALAMPARLFHELGGFDASFPRAAGEDREVCRRWIARGYELVCDPGISVSHRHEMHLGSFWRKHFHYGRGAWQFYSQKAAGKPRRFTTGTLIKLLLSPFETAPLMRAAMLSGLLAVSQVATAVGFLFEWSSQAMGFSGRRKTA